MARVGWEEEIRQAQECTRAPIYLDDQGSWSWFTRVRYGQEGAPWTTARPCHDCDVVAGQFHVPGCDVERCPKCNGQSISCACEYLEEAPTTLPVEGG